MEGGNLRDPQVLPLPAAWPIGSRDGTFAKDSFLSNLFIEKKKDGRIVVQKRPGSTSYTTFDGGGAGTSQGLWNFNGYLLAANNNNLTRIVSPTSSGFTTGAAWSYLTAPPWRGRSAFASVRFQNKIFVIGGQTGATTCIADVWASPDGGTTWQQLVSAAPWGVRCHQEAVVFNNELYIMGGSDLAGNFYNDVWKTSDGVNWTQVCANAGWSARSSFVALAFNNGIWVLGGRGAGDLNDVWFSTDGNTWTQQINAATWSARSLHGGVVFAGKMWIMGGTTGTREVWSSSDGITWANPTATAWGAAKRDFGCCAYNGLMYVAMGFNGGTYTTDVYSSPDGATWTLVTAAFGGSARGACRLVVGPHPTSTVGAPTLFLIGGTDLVPNYLKEFWVANINGTLGTTWSIPSSGSNLRMQAVPVNDNESFAIKDTAGMYVFYANTVTKVSDPNYPAVTVPGVVNLDETVYVMDPTGLIVGSAIGNPNVWPSRNFLGADYESDPGVKLLKYQNFVMAIGQFTTQFLINTGAAGGTLLRPVKNMNIRIGGAFPHACIEIEDTVIWPGRMKDSKDIQMFKMAGNQMRVISTAAVDRILALWSSASIEQVIALSVKAKGHSLYVITNFVADFGLAYDLNEDEWYRISSVVGGGDHFYLFTDTATDGTNNYALQFGTKTIATIDEGTFNDLGNPPLVQVVTGIIDNGAGNLRKFCSDIALVCDRVTGGSVTIEWSKNDYQTWSTPIALSIDQTRVHAPRVGQYTKIAYRIKHNLNSDFRMERFDASLRIGN